MYPAGVLKIQGIQPGKMRRFCAMDVTLLLMLLLIVPLLFYVIVLTSLSTFSRWGKHNSGISPMVFNLPSLIICTLELKSYSPRSSRYIPQGDACAYWCFTYLPSALGDPALLAI